MIHRSIIFDLDGTLADTLADIAAAANHALAEMGRPTFDVQRYRYLAGQGLHSLMTDALGPGHAGLVPRGMELFRAYYSDHWTDHTAPYPGVPALLDELTRRGVRMAVLSNKPDSATQAMMKHGFARWRFDAVIGQREGKPLKPDPAGALEIAETCGVPAKEWLYVGDTKVDMMTATRAGMFAVGVLWGFRDEPELRDNGARVIIREPAELLALV
ncbi:MAG: HAD family hydrolase [Planctomycetes bacterium]|nr:HAD family hydrolase [Planctomycetota bacterium]